MVLWSFFPLVEIFFYFSRAEGRGHDFGAVVNIHLDAPAGSEQSTTD